ncbi:MAG: chitobiase/beta-hexosaminidase C-terminal domain-containing protein [Prevotella sp.]|nr:chitobiase/beta-hexosaminidase C-terminal domain-containing protein [Prevotella sp.]
MKKIFTVLFALLLVPTMMSAQGWPVNYKGVMLQGFYWDSFDATKWTTLTQQADELSETFDLIWIPQSGNCGGMSMGYDPLYWFPGNGHYNSSFGTEEELRTMIQTFRDKGLKTIGDVVVNHRKNLSNWVDFPQEAYGGATYQLQSTDICKNDDGGATQTWATNNGYTLSANNDTGEDWGGMRDLDHKSENVQQNVKAYVKMLLEELGYAGFRYDMVKGYSASYTKMYNEYANPEFSIGEYWDGTSRIKSWIDNTGKRSAAFDFQFRYTVRNAANNGDWTKLGQQNDGNWPLVSNDAYSGDYRQWAVTFVENHDTERRSGAAQDPLLKDTLAANAYLLAMPGTPCVFMTHWRACKNDIKSMIAVRRAAGIMNTSGYENMLSTKTYYANYILNGTDRVLLVAVGNVPQGMAPNGFTRVLEGYHYAYFLPNTMETAWIDKASGEYTGSIDVMLSAVSATNGAELVYTTDGTEPTASSTKVASGTKLTIDSDCTLKVGLLVGGTVKNIITRNYVISESQTITVHVNADAVSTWTTMNFWTWGGNGTHAPASGAWPGDRVNDTKTVNGKTFYYKEFTLSGSDDFVNFVFSAGSGSPQTVNVENVTTNKFYEILNEKEGSNYKVQDVTSAYTDIAVVRTEQPRGAVSVYTLDGRLLRTVTTPADALNGLPRGIYIVGGKKVVK